MNKLDFFNEVCHLLDDIPLTDVLSFYDIEVRHPHAYNAHALCPFHGDKTMGSFVITNKRKIYKCFSCNKGGGSVHKLIMDLNEIQPQPKSFPTAIMDVAMAFKLVSVEQYEWFFEQAISDDVMQSIQNFYLERKPQMSTPRAPIDQLDKIYQLFIKLACTPRKNPSPLPQLSLAHYEYLKEERQLSDDAIIRGGYFTMPKSVLMSRFAELISDEFSSTSIESPLDNLKGVPGFYQYRDSLKWSFSSCEGIGIPIRNAQQQIQGIQIRYDQVKEGSPRYRWFTSSYCNEFHPKYINGVGVGAPTDIFYPPCEAKEYSSAIFITEGRFKAHQLADTFNSVSVSVQGINTWKGIENEIRFLLMKHPTLTHFYIAFDADMVFNPNVFDSAIAMAHFLKETFPQLILVYILWDETLGKGIDDVILAQAQSSLVKAEQCWFESQYLRYQQQIEKTFQLTHRQDWRTLEPQLLKATFYDLILSHFPVYRS